MIRAYEIQTFQGGVWQVDSVFDDEELAIFEARLLHERGRYVGVRVVLETYNPDTDEISARTVLKLEKTTKADTEARGRKTATAKKARKKNKKAGSNKVAKKRTTPSKSKNRKSGGDWAGVGLKAFLLILLGLAIMFGLRAAFQYL